MFHFRDQLDFCIFQTQHKQYGDVLLLLFSDVFQVVGVRGPNRLPLQGILSLCETSELLFGLKKKVTRASMGVGVSSKWVKF